MTRNQRLIARVVEKLADGDQGVAAKMLGVRQGSISRYLSDNPEVHRSPRLSVVILAEMLLKQRRKVVPK